MFNLFFFASTFVLSVAGVWVRIFSPHRGLALVMSWARLELAAARVICGLRFRVHGLPHLPSGPMLIASQHQSTFDTLVWFALLPGCSYVAKRELTRIPLFGPLIPLAGQIVVDRRLGPTALRGLVRDARRGLGEGRQVVIFPEGSRAQPGRPLPIQPGIVALASATRLAVIPVLTDSGRFWGRRAFQKRAGTIAISVLPPLPPALSRDALTRSLETLFAGPIGDDASQSTGNGVFRLHAPSDGRHAN